MKKTIWCSILLLGSAVLRAQTPVGPAPASPSPAGPPRVAAPPPVAAPPAPAVDGRLAKVSALDKTDVEYRLGPGDLIEISVFEVEYKHEVRINAAGLIKLPLLEPITAAGLTPAELEQRLTEALDGELIKRPQVTVFVKEYRSQPVFVLGAVGKPGQYQITLPLKIVDVLSMAGGLTANAGDEAVIQRHTPDGADEVIKVNLRQLLDEADISLNVPVKGGDVVHIEDRPVQMVYVVGEVNRSGAYQLPAKQDLRISQAIAWAGGPTKTAKMGDGILVRYNDAGQREQLSVDFGQILSGKKPDFLVRADDIIFVPGSKAKNLGYSLLGLLPGTIANVPYVIAR